jgi:hypothetical protein
MNFQFRGIAMSSVLVFAGALGCIAQAQQTPPLPSVPVRVTVTVGPKEGAKEAPPEVTKDDVLVIQKKKERLPVTEWVPAKGDKGAMQFAIVIDEGVGPSLGSQFSDIKEFISGLGPEAKIGLFYAQNGTVSVASEFSNDHAAVIKALRLPLGRVAAYSSIYFSLDDLMKRWPATSDRREILLVADGFDYLNGPYSTYPDNTVEHAQKNGIMIHTIYASEAGRHRRNFFLLNVGQSNLGKLADGTGGESYFQGNYTPIAFQPYLNELTKVLNEQYWLTFLAKPETKGKLQAVKITTEINGVELSAPEMVFVPGSGEKMKK